MSRIRSLKTDNENIMLICGYNKQDGYCLWFFEHRDGATGRLIRSEKSYNSEVMADYAFNQNKVLFEDG